MQDKAAKRDTTSGTAPALKGIKVLDLTQFEAGPSCTEALAWFGADVVKVEEPNRGEPGRWGFSDRSDADSHYFIYYNLNKRSITCNLKTDEGKALLRRMIEKADVLVENMAPGTFARLGFDYPRLSEINARLILAQANDLEPECPPRNTCAPGGLDDWCYIFCSRGNEDHWRRLVRAIGREDLLADPRMTDGPTRAKNQAAVDAAITEWTSKRTKQEVTEIVAGAGVPCGAGLTTPEP